MRARPPPRTQAGRERASVLLQSAQTWSNIGPRHFLGDSLRAIENGLTLVR